MGISEALNNDKKVRLLRVLFYGFLVVITGGLSLLALISLRPSNLNPLDLQVGNVAPHDILSPYALTYESTILTQQQKEAAGQAVAPVYTSPDTGLARQQVAQLRATLNFISKTRTNDALTFESKLLDLETLDTASLQPATANYLLTISDAQWQSVQQEAITVLQQVMRNPIRETQIDDIRRNIPNLVSFSMSEEQAQVVSELVSLFVLPNSFYSEEITQSRRDAAIESVPPVFRSFVKGETVVLRGKVITQADAEALQQLGLLSQGDENTYFLTASSVILIALVLLVIVIYRLPGLLFQPKRSGLIVILLLVYLYIARALIYGDPLWPFLFPIASYGLLVAGLFGMFPGVISVLVLTILVTFGAPNPFELSIYYLLGGVFGILMLGKARRTTAYFWGGFAIASMSAAFVITFRLVDPFTTRSELFELLGAALFNGVASSGITILLLYFSAQFLGMTSPLQLVELVRPDHPLLRFLLLNAPGTYQHSLQVANLAEQAAEQIGADTMLTRVGALYHDVGKSLHPQYFIENQVGDISNIHETLSPEESALIIIRHVTDGLVLAKKHRLPNRIQQFISEHHGTMVTRYQYIKAIQAANGDETQVDLSQFVYPGPKPQSRETSLVMLADGCEARIRAERPTNETQLAEAIKETINNRLVSGQLNNVDLTTRDLTIIIDSFTATLRGIYHPRIEYPKLETPTPVEPLEENIPVDPLSADTINSESRDLYQENAE